MTLETLLPHLLLYIVLPLWLVAGLGDYLCHRHTRIELTSGARESWLHLLEYLELAVPLLAGLYLHINALVLTLMFAFVIAHSATAVWDTSYTAPRRDITVAEQHVHGWLEVLPWSALAIVVALHWNELSAGDWSLRWREEPLASSHTLPVLAGLALALMAIADELRRTLRAARRSAPRLA